MESSIISPAISLLMKHLVIGQRQKTAPNFSAFHWSPHGSLVSIGQHFITMRVVHLQERTETSLIKRNKSPNRTKLCGPCIAGIAVFFFFFLFFFWGGGGDMQSMCC